MQRIQPVDAATASPETAELLAAVKKQMGGVPRILGTMARSHAALAGYLGLAGAVSAGRLPAGLREQVALAVAGANGCDYCASAHTVLGGMQGIAKDELARNLRAESSDPRSAAALKFVTRVLATRGNVSDDEIAATREAGFDDEEIVELVANTVLNVFTNYFNHVAATEIDFPVVKAGHVAKAA